MLALPIPTVDSVYSFISAYVEPYVVLVLLLGAVMWLGLRAISGRRFATAKRAIRDEVRLNIRTCATIIEYAEGQKTGDPYSIPIPRFHTAAFENLVSWGYLFKLRHEISDELVAVYETVERVHAASDRQEELAVGIAATSPMAADLRNRSLTFVRDNVNNVVRPRLERLDSYYRKKW